MGPKLSGNLNCSVSCISFYELVAICVPIFSFPSHHHSLMPLRCLAVAPFISSVVSNPRGEGAGCCLKFSGAISHSFSLHTYCLSCFV